MTLIIFKLRINLVFALRNRLLASIAESESNFEGHIKDLPKIGKTHENGATYEKVIENLVGYVMKEYMRGRDQEHLIRTQEDD